MPCVKMLYSDAPRSCQVETVSSPEADKLADATKRAANFLYIVESSIHKFFRGCKGSGGICCHEEF